MGHLHQILDFMADERKLPLALFFALLPSVVYAAVFSLSGLPIDFVSVGAGLLSDVIFWLLISAALYVLVFVLKEKGRYGFVSIMNRLSLIFAANFLLMISAVAAILLVAPTFFSVIGKLPQATTGPELRAIVESLPIASDPVLMIAVLAFLIIGLLILVFSAYVIYRTIADYSKGSFIRNSLIFIALIAVMAIINFAASIFL